MIAKCAWFLLLTKTKQQQYQWLSNNDDFQKYLYAVHRQRVKKQVLCCWWEARSLSLLFLYQKNTNILSRLKCYSTCTHWVCCYWEMFMDFSLCLSLSLLWSLDASVCLQMCVCAHIGDQSCHAEICKDNGWEPRTSDTEQFTKITI